MTSTRSQRCGLRWRVAAVLGILVVQSSLSACGSSTTSPPEAPAPPSTSATTQPPAEETPEPELSEAEKLQARAVEIVENASVRENAASIIVGTIAGTNAHEISTFVETRGLGGFIVMGNNVPNDAGQLQVIAEQLSPDPTFPRLIAIDEEGGEVTRLPWAVIPGANTLKYETPEHTQTAFADRASVLAASGVNLNFGIVADYTSDEWSFIYGRSLGVTPEDAATRVSAAVEGEQGVVASTLKHFPGHGSVPGDSHVSIPSTELPFTTWSTNDALPFIAGIDAGAPALMFGHLTYFDVDETPASLSSEWHRIAREELGFTGVAVTDDMGMLVSSGLPEYQDQAANTVSALAAGNDLIVLIAYADPAVVDAAIEAIVAAVEDDHTLDARLEEAAIRVAELRLELGSFQ